MRGDPRSQARDLKSAGGLLEGAVARRPTVHDTGRKDTIRARDLVNFRLVNDVVQCIARAQTFFALVLEPRAESDLAGQPEAGQGREQENASLR